MESFLTYLACCQNKVNFIIHSAGILDGYSYTSYEKVISDFEVIRYVHKYLKEFEINDDTIPLDLIDEVGHNGEYLTKDHTFQYCHTEPLAPTVCSRGNVTDPAHQYQINIEKRYDQLMDLYQAKAPVCDQAVLDKIKDIFTAQGISRELLDSIEKM
jgi:trimethylamine--corrinoid protein Co-methyltransferase